MENFYNSKITIIITTIIDSSSWINNKNLLINSLTVIMRVSKWTNFNDNNFYFDKIEKFLKINNYSDNCLMI